jgi:hypothetical protein
MGRSAYTEPQYLYKGDLYFFYLLVLVTISEVWSTDCAQAIMQSMTGQLKFLACNKIGRII